MSQEKPRILIVGASRGIGLGLAKVFADHGWDVVATERKPLAGGELESLAAAGKLTIETVDIADAASSAALRDRLSGQVFDAILVNAGVSGPRNGTWSAVSREGFADLFETNTLGPVRLAELLVDNVRPRTGVVGLMTSMLGSVADNTSGGYELYRASKAALNSLTRSFAASHRDLGLAVLSLHPGWVRTDMGGPNAAIDVATSVNGLYAVVERARGDRQSGYIDYKGDTLAW